MWSINELSNVVDAHAECVRLSDMAVPMYSIIQRGDEYKRIRQNFEHSRLKLTSVWIRNQLLKRPCVALRERDEGSQPPGPQAETMGGKILPPDTET